MKTSTLQRLHAFMLDLLILAVIAILIFAAWRLITPALDIWFYEVKK